MSTSATGIRLYALVAVVVAAGLSVVVVSVARWRLRAVSQVDGWRRACERGDGPSCQQMGWHYEQGDLVAQDLDRAQQFYQRACDGGYGLGCFFAGTLWEGAGQKARAQEAYRRACQGGSVPGCTSLHRLLGKRESARTH